MGNTHGGQRESQVCHMHVAVTRFDVYTITVIILYYIILY